MWLQLYQFDKIQYSEIMEKKMEVTSERFLAILKSALLGQKANITEELLLEDWQKLFDMASIHNVLPMFYEAVYASPSLQQANVPFVVMAKRQVMQQVMLQTRRTSEFLDLNKKLHAAGVKPLVVKGIICRNLYPQPDHRQSGDEDVLVPADQFETCHMVMTEFGMQTAEDESNLLGAYEVPYRKMGSPLYIELHKHLFPPESDAYGDMNRFFEGVFDRAIVEDIQGVPVCTMGYTDHLFYLICHAFKHFLHSGFGIRQVCDIIMFANKYGTQIDWTQVLNKCKEINADKFAAALFQIGSKYLTFDPEQAAYPLTWRNIKVDELPMLEDLLSSGIYGDANMSRKHSSNITLDAVAAQKQGRKAKGSMLSSVFPSVSQLESRYPYLRKHPYLLPVAWCSRLWKYFRETKRSHDNSAAEALKIGNERINLMKEYGILK